MLYIIRNQLTGCIPPALLEVDQNDLDELDLMVCAATPTMTSASTELGARSLTTSGSASTGAGSSSESTEESVDSDNPLKIKAGTSVEDR